ncbi:hypothetical protein [Nocardioides sp.]|uniref:hypothetical protein n=1 Tax=Nocardioides sp. TaxID=35761 RepID=UPI002BA5FA1E|nr:hypothetical protein [Nocardioides sp.]HSX68767.1 hypothetical protein [Nocardioides sp.]
MAKPPEYLGLSPTAWDVIASATTAVGIIVAAIAAVYAGRQYALSREAFRDQTRPYMVVSCKPGLTSNHIADIVVANIGTTPARRVSIKIDPPFVRAEDEGGYVLGDARLFSEPTDMWPPGHEVRAYLDSHIDRAGREDLPAQHTVTVTYSDGRKGHWQERHVLDLELGKGLMFAEAYGVHHMAKALREISSVIKSSSVLKRGHVDVTVEARAERVERVRAQNRQGAEQLRQFRDRLLPDGGSDDGT